MLSGRMDKITPSARRLVKERVASRIQKKDATLYSFSKEAQECAERFMGWADAASNVRFDEDAIQAFADEAVADGIKNVVLVGQGGSTQAPMTITKYNKIDSNRVNFRTIDSDSPVRVRELMAKADPRDTLYILASKSGSTIEPRTMMGVLRECMAKSLTAEQIPQHLVAITDPGSDLEKQATEEGWRGCFLGEPTIGGRFSAISVFGFLPAALVGIDLKQVIKQARIAEQICSDDVIDNPAIGLAAFLYDNYRRGRDKFCFLTPKRGRVLGLWIEQLVAESLGKQGKGILPNIEINSLLLSRDWGDRCVIKYETKNDSWDERKNFEMSLAYIDPSIPSLNYKIESAYELAEHFVMWEYAIAMCGYLMKVCPFDQPDVASVKAKVLDILKDGAPKPSYTQEFYGCVSMGDVEVRVSEVLNPERDDLKEALSALFASVKPGDYFAMDVFLPFTGEGRREALEDIRRDVAEMLHVVSCLEVGPRYMHSTGQLQKGGSNTGVFLLLSSGELKDIQTKSEARSLGALAKAQAIGDWAILSERGRRCLHLHLPDNTGVTLRALQTLIRGVLAEVTSRKPTGESLFDGGNKDNA